ncbi:MAG: hypothetical protein HFG41_11285 [Coprococcus sp.]|nr:hypothetical protein [Coprococcus sp.]
MTERTEYAVLRFLDQNGYCHTVNDVVRGHSVMQYAKDGAAVSKKMMFCWAAELAQQMESYYKCCDGQAYGYVNPCAVIVPEEGNSVLLLDTADAGSTELVKRMQKKKLRLLFVRKKHVLSQNMKPEDDWYGFGRTLQFIEEKCCIGENFTYRERRTLRRIREQCIEEDTADFPVWEEVRRDFRRLAVSAEKGRLGKKQRKRLFLGAAAFVMIVAVWANLSRRQAGADRAQAAQAKEVEAAAKKKEEKEEKEREEKEKLLKKAEEQEMACQEAERGEAQAYLEMGLVYLTELGDYENSRVYLEQASKELNLAKHYLKIVQAVQSADSEDYVKRGLEQAIRDAREELKSMQEEQVKNRSFLYKTPFLLACSVLDTEESWKQAAEITEEIRIESVQAELAQDTEKEKELDYFLAQAYEKLEEKEKAIKEYEKLKEMEQEEELLEKIYLKLLELYDEKEEIAREAIETLPELGENEEFQRMKEEYGLLQEDEDA